MRRIVYVGTVGMLALSLAAPTARPGLLGTSVSGQMLLSGDFHNWFDPDNLFVPSGYGNSSPHGPNSVIISDPIVEFIESDPINIQTVDFTDSGGKLHVLTLGGSVPVKYIFTNSAFSGATVEVLSDTFPGGSSVSLVGDVLTVQTPTFHGTCLTCMYYGSFAVSFSIVPGTLVPEPASLALLATASAGLLGISRLRRRRA